MQPRMLHDIMACYIPLPQGCFTAERITHAFVRVRMAALLYVRRQHLCRAQAIAKKLIRLREALPNTDISKLVARSPAVLLELTPATVAARVSQLRSVPWH